MLIKAQGRIPVIVSRSRLPIWQWKLAVQLGITVIGFARGQRMNIYSIRKELKF
jgi:FdhD protein